MISEILHGLQVRKKLPKKSYLQKFQSQCDNFIRNCIKYKNDRNDKMNTIQIPSDNLHRNNSNSTDMMNLCICHQPYSSHDIYISCDHCNNWYHPQCVGLRIHEIKALSKYKCPLCESKETASNNTNHQPQNDMDLNIAPNDDIEEHNGISDDEILIAEVPIKAIYRWDEDDIGHPCWKKRVIDTKLQFLQNPNNGKQRIIARDTETNKLKIDQFIYDYYRDSLQMKSKKSYTWNAMDSILQQEYNK